MSLNEGIALIAGLSLLGGVILIVLENGPPQLIPPTHSQLYKLRGRASHLPTGKINPWVNHYIRQITDQVQDQADQGVHIQRAKHDRVITVNRRFKTE